MMKHRRPRPKRSYAKETKGAKPAQTENERMKRTGRSEPEEGDEALLFRLYVGRLFHQESSSHWIDRAREAGRSGSVFMIYSKVRLGLRGLGVKAGESWPRCQRQRYLSGG